MLTFTTYFFIAVALILIIALIVVYSKNHNRKEKFTDSNDAYQSRLTVIDVFDSYLQRNPTPKEINRYSSLKNEQDILAAVMKDFPKVENYTEKKNSPEIDQAENQKEVENQFEMETDNITNNGVSTTVDDNGEKMIQIPISHVKKLKDTLQTAVLTVQKNMGQTVELLEQIESMYNV